MSLQSSPNPDHVPLIPAVPMPWGVTVKVTLTPALLPGETEATFGAKDVAVIVAEQDPASLTLNEPGGPGKVRVRIVGKTAWPITVAAVIRKLRRKRVCTGVTSIARQP